STVISLNEWETALLSAAVSTSGEVAASVVSTASMVAMFGESIAAPLAVPPTTNPSASTTTCLVLVSVVNMAAAAAAADSGEDPRPLIRPGKAASILAMSSGIPIVPVEQT